MHSYLSSVSGYSLTAGRWSSLPPTLTKAERIVSCWSGSTLVILPRGHIDLGVLGSKITTKSPSCRLGCFPNHFFRSAIVGRYTFIQRRQNSVASASAYLHRFLKLKSLSQNRSTGKFGFARPVSKLCGVSISGSAESSVRYVRGRPFKRFSTIESVVTRISSLLYYPFTSWLQPWLVTRELTHSRSTTKLFQCIK